LVLLVLQVLLVLLVLLVLRVLLVLLLMVSLVLLVFLLVVLPQPQLLMPQLKKLRHRPKRTPTIKMESRKLTLLSCAAYY
jgi:hypothetical protein